MKSHEYFLVALLFGLNAASAEYTTDPVHGPILNNQTTFMYRGECTTDVNGECEIVIPPGDQTAQASAFSATFANGYLPPINPNGRYVQGGMCQVDNGEQGDAVAGLQVEDRIGHIPEAARVAFPSYPVVSRFFDSAIDGSSQGWFLEPNTMTRITALGFPKFLPFPLKLVAKFKAKTAAAGKKIRCNYNLSKYELVK